MLTRLLYSPFLVQIVVTRRCNLACSYCNEFDRDSAPVPTEDLRRRFARIRGLGAWALEFSGGEPILHPDIYALTRYAKTLGFAKVMLITNGYLLSEERVRRLNEAGLDDLQISIDGVEPTDLTVKVLRPLKPKLEAVKRTARFRVTLNAVIGSAPSAEVLEVLRFARAHGFRPNVQLIHTDDGQLKLSRDDLALYEQVQRDFGLGGSSTDYRATMMRTGRAPFRCRAGSRYLYVDEAGMVRWCSQQRGGFGIPLEQYTLEDLRRQFDTRKGCNERCTVGCVRTCSKYEEWRPQRLEYRPQ